LITARRIILVCIILIFISTNLGAQLPGRYTRYEQELQTLVNLEAAYPEICNLDTMGYSTRDSIPMLRFKISDNVLQDEEEPAVFYCGGVHADEVLSVEVVAWFIQDILDRYALQDSAALRYINEIEIFCVPFINPEGHIVVEEGDLIWRKNKCDNDSNGIFDIHDGVDNNRNYDFGWSIDNGLDALTPESLQYKGTAPFTQIENVAMAQFAWKYRPMVALDYHSPTYGRSEVAYYPWWWWPSDGGQGASPDEALMYALCRQYCGLIVDDRGDSTYEARRALVDKGDYKTYFYGNFGTAAFSVEVSDTTIQDSTMIDDICERHLPSQYFLLHRTLGPAIIGVIRDSVTLEPLEAEVQVTELINPDIRPRLSRPDNGWHRRIMAPGTYTLRVLKTGYRTKTITGVVVPSDGPRRVDVLLPPINPRPPAPILIYPPQDSAIYDAALTFVWHQTPFAQMYRLEVYSDSSLTIPVFIDSLVSDTSLTIDIQSGDTTIYWQVRGGNQYGWGPFSFMWSFYFFSSPAAPIMVFPPQNSVLYDTMLTFIWRDSPAAERYLLEIYGDSALTIPLYSDSLIVDTLSNPILQNPDSMYYWRVKGSNSFGWGPYSQVWSFAFHFMTGVGEGVTPDKVALASNYPNPFNAGTAISVAIPGGASGRLTIFDIGGRLVKEFALLGDGEPGFQRVYWDARDSNGQPVGSGVYFYRLKVGDSTITNKMTLLK